MEQFQLLRQKSIKKIKVADHMLTMSYSLVKDPKILLSVINNVYDAYDHAITALLEYERLFKRVQAFKDNTDSKINLFIKISDKLKIDKEHIKIIRELDEIKKAHKKSPVEFSRKGKFVICSDSYEMKTLEIKHLKNYINKAKIFIEQIHKLTDRDDGIFR
ncbi:MAG: hypothetical protein ACMXX7_01370 [Candidatus Woesearchaeota archaeon]